LKTKSHEYKKTLNSSFTRHQRLNAKKLKALSKSDPNSFWNFLKRPNSNKCNSSLSDMFEYFKNTNSDTLVNVANLLGQNEVTDDFVNCDNSVLNNDISIAEIEKAVKNLRNNKSCGVDRIVNEHIKCTFTQMKHVYLKLFNIVFKTAILPECWSIGIINPIYKNKGDMSDPANYLPITLLSCLGKLFTTILNNRLLKYVEDNDIISKYQAGFRPYHSTVDNMFVPNLLIEHMFSMKQKLFCAFIDLKGAFDSINRNMLWLKLRHYNISGNVLTSSKVCTNMRKVAYE